MCVCFTQGVDKVVLQNLIPAQTRQLVFISVLMKGKLTIFCGNLLEQNNCKNTFWEMFFLKQISIQAPVYGRSITDPLSRKLDASKTVTTSFWSWLSGKSPEEFQRCSRFARQRFGWKSAVDGGASIMRNYDTVVSDINGISFWHRGTSLQKKAPP